MATALPLSLTTTDSTTATLTGSMHTTGTPRRAARRATEHMINQQEGAPAQLSSQQHASNIAASCTYSIYSLGIIGLM